LLFANSELSGAHNFCIGKGLDLHSLITSVGFEFHVMSAEVRSGLSPTTRALVALAAFVVIIAGMKTAQPIIVPFLLAGFITIILVGPLRWLQSKGLSSWVAMLVVLVTAFLFVLLIATLVGNSIDQFRSSLPEYQARLEQYSSSLSGFLQKFGVAVPDSGLSSELSPARMMGIAGDMLGQLSGLVANGFVILLYVAFMLAELSGITQKVNKAFDNPTETLQRVTQFTEGANNYMAIKAGISAFTGALVSIMLWGIGVDFPILWGVFAALLNFIPNIGSIFAAVPAVLLALVQLGVGPAVLAAIGYLVINIVIGSIVEPKFMGQRVGLSTLVVFVSLIFWGWVLGPAGMLLSIPLTMLVKIGLDKREDTHWIATLLS